MTRAAGLRPPLGVLAIAAATMLAGCFGIGGDLPRLREQAQAALARWADAVAAAGGPAVVPVGDLTGQVGNWEADVGDNKLALLGGAIEADGTVPLGDPGPGEVAWQDGTTTSVQLISAEQALADIRGAVAEPCDCAPLRVTGARLTTGPVETSRGTATAPLWEFTIEGTAVKVTHVAIGDRVLVHPPPWDETDPPIGVWIEMARGAPGASELTVTFTGAPLPGNQSCGEDYSTEAIESELAVVVIVVRHAALTFGGCPGAGATRTALAELAAPLGDRTVLQVYDGTPVRMVLDR